jgi:hypothetical protein
MFEHQTRKMIMEAPTTGSSNTNSKTQISCHRFFRRQREVAS